jgi:hypothetical protein
VGKPGFDGDINRKAAGYRSQDGSTDDSGSGGARGGGNGGAPIPVVEEV